MDVNRDKQRSEYFAPWRANDFAPEHSTFGETWIWENEESLKTP